MITPFSLAFQREDPFIINVISILGEGLMKPEGILHILTHCRTNIDDEERWTGPGGSKFHLIGTSLGVQSNKFLDPCLKYLSEMFAFLEKTPFSDFSIMDVRNVPQNVGELAAYGNEELANLVDHFSSILTDDEVQQTPQQWRALRAKLKQSRKKNPQEVLSDLVVAKT